jgi:hypothetical protein
MPCYRKACDPTIDLARSSCRSWLWTTPAIPGTTYRITVPAMHGLRPDRDINSTGLLFSPSETRRIIPPSEGNSTEANPTSSIHATQGPALDQAHVDRSSTRTWPTTRATPTGLQKHRTSDSTAPSKNGSPSFIRFPSDTDAPLYRPHTRRRSFRSWGHKAPPTRTPGRFPSG